MISQRKALKFNKIFKGKGGTLSLLYMWAVSKGKNNLLQREGKSLIKKIKTYEFHFLTFHFAESQKSFNPYSRLSIFKKYISLTNRANWPKN